MTDLAGFLRARLLEDQDAAGRAAPHDRPRALAEIRAKRGILDLWDTIRPRMLAAGQANRTLAYEQVLAERQAYYAVLKLIAAPYRDHPGYLDVWAP
jgi:hypothetical protein